VLNRFTERRSPGGFVAKICGSGGNTNRHTGGCTSTPASSRCPEAGGGAWTPDLAAAAKGVACSLYASAVEFSVPLEHIADVAGHDGTRMTGGIYRHVLAPVISHAAEPMDRLFGDAG